MTLHPFPLVECVLLRFVCCGPGRSGNFAKRAILPLGANIASVSLKSKCDPEDIVSVTCQTDGTVGTKRLERARVERGRAGGAIRLGDVRLDAVRARPAGDRGAGALDHSSLSRRLSVLPVPLIPFFTSLMCSTAGRCSGVVPLISCIVLRTVLPTSCAARSSGPWPRMF